MENNKINAQALGEIRTLTLKAMAETFLLTQGNKKTAEMFPKNDLERARTLYDGDIELLHHWLNEEYARVGLNLKELIEATGEKVVPGKLSQFELKELLVRADELIISIGVLEEYKKAQGLNN